MVHSWCFIPVGFSQHGEPGAGSPAGCGADRLGLDHSMFMVFCRFFSAW